MHCYTYRFRGLRELPLEEKLRVAKSIGEAGVEYVNLTGGEPLIHPHFKPLLGVLSSYGIEKSVVTNATLVREDVAELLYRTETFIYVTIEGPQEVHDSIRGKGSYAAALRGAKLLRERVGGISVVSTVNKLNYKRVHEVVDVAAYLDSDEVNLLPIMPSGRALETRIYISAAEYLEALELTYERAKEQGLKVNAWCTPFAPLLKSDVASWFCRSMSGMDVDPAGNVLLCDILDFRVTSVVGKSIEEAFDEFRKHQLVKTVMNPPSLPQACRSCMLEPACRGGCFARAYMLKKDLNAGDPLCPRIAGVKY